ncbi:MAG: TROVE domain-containing protein [Opitutaceae bacterium]
MANKTLFKTSPGRLLPSANTRNEAGGSAYRLDPKQELAQYVMTGCVNGTYYASAQGQLDKVLKLCAEVSDTFIAQLALYARKQGYMKDTPALLCAVLTTRDPQVFDWVAHDVIDNAKMLRNFVQIMRSGIVGRKSLGTRPKRFVQEWLFRQSDDALFRGSVGQNPSMADILKMVHPKPETDSRAALYAYLIGRDCDASALPQLVQEYEAFKAQLLDRAAQTASAEGRSVSNVLSKLFQKSQGSAEQLEVPKVPFQMLTALSLTSREWVAIACNAGWQMTRMNLNTFARHGVFKVEGMKEMIANRLADADAVRRSRVFPYQLLASYTAIGKDIPHVVKDALQDAMEVAVENVPRVRGQVYICPDSSASMASPVTGYRKGSTSSVTCVQVAALVAAVFLRQNRSARVLPFHDRVIPVDLNARDSIMTNATKLSSLGWGGTNCSAPLAELNRTKAKGDLVIFVSDNESWMDRQHGRATATMNEWNTFKQRNPKARLVCIDIQPYGTTQAAEREDILNVGGFSDQVFQTIADFANGALDDGHWVKVIESVKL